MELNKYIDHTLLKQDATKEEIKKLCEEAKEYNFKSVCVNPTHIKYAKENLKGSDVLVCTVIGFPLGANSTKVKAFEAENSVNEGADEIDMVINIGALKDKDYDFVKDDIKQVVSSAQGKTVKVIVETCLLTEEEKVKICEIVKESGADFIKTSTGFSTGGATIEDIKLFKREVGDVIKIKASGGVRTLEDAENMIENGANRLGTSGGVNIILGKKNNKGY